MHSIRRASYPPAIVDNESWRSCQAKTGRRSGFAYRENIHEYDHDDRTDYMSISLLSASITCTDQLDKLNRLNLRFL
jgi:hypothetical protein